jgi:2-(1,2-epoxy-1,2-dihydrophenyl)acetyl-CoA isomerase
LREEPVLFERREAVAILTLNRPEKLNAFNEAMHQALRGALEAIRGDDAIRAVLLTGAGRGFCSGQDLTAIVEADPDDIADLLDSYHPVIEKIRELPLPVVAAVNGVAAGAGCNLALACDIVIAARSATFVQAFSRIGLVPDCGGTWFLPRLVGTARARALMMLAEPLPAATAAAWGMIWQVVDDERLMPEARALTARLASGPTVALGLIKQALDESGDNDLADQLDLERDLQIEAAESPDRAEGVRAFLDKRPPVFTGSRD